MLVGNIPFNPDNLVVPNLPMFSFDGEDNRLVQSGPTATDGIDISRPTVVAGSQLADNNPSNIRVPNSTTNATPSQEVPANIPTPTPRPSQIELVKVTPEVQMDGLGVSSAARLVQVAERDARVGSEKYLEGIANGDYGSATDKCNEAVADWIEQAGLGRPQVPYNDLRGLIATRDPTAHEWADSNVDIPGWSKPMPVSQAQPGDVIAAFGPVGGHGHVGIVDAEGFTISVSSRTLPAGIVVLNTWGFRPGSPVVVVRRYIGN